MLCLQPNWFDNLANGFHEDECEDYKRKSLCCKYIHHKKSNRNFILKKVVLKKLSKENFLFKRKKFLCVYVHVYQNMYIKHQKNQR